MAGLGFALVIAPITFHALSAASENQKGMTSSLVVVSRMMGMTLGLAALSAWGVDYLQGLIEGHDFPLVQVGEAARAFELRAAEYSANVNAAELELFQSFFACIGDICSGCAACDIDDSGLPVHITGPLNEDGWEI